MSTSPDTILGSAVRCPARRAKTASGSARMRFGQRAGRTPHFAVARKRDTTTTLHPYTTGGWWFSSSITSFSNVQSVQPSKAPFLTQECGFRLDSGTLGRCPRCPVGAFGVPPVGWTGPGIARAAHITLPRPITHPPYRYSLNHRMVDPVRLNQRPGESPIPLRQQGSDVLAGPDSATVGHCWVTVRRVARRHHRRRSGYRTTCCQPVRSVPPVGDGRGRPIKTQIPHLLGPPAAASWTKVLFGLVRFISGSQTYDRPTQNIPPLDHRR